MKMPPSIFSLLIFSLFLLRRSAAIIPRTTLLRSTLVSEPSPSSSQQTTYFEVTKPIRKPDTKPFSRLLLDHTFASSYGKSPVLSEYIPPPFMNYAKIVLEWTATSKGRQFDRIFGVWLGGVELLRSCTAEPRPAGIIWTVEKDITRYHSLLMTNQTLAVYIGNIVDATYTGVYNVKLNVHFYPYEKNPEKPSFSRADLIVPISRNLPLNDGLWFEIQNSTHRESKVMKIPQNAYRAVLEVYVSFHENDEFWYMNYPNEYITVNNLTNTPGNGPFREVVVSLDGNIAGAVWPFTVIYTGGVNPLLWRPITGIGSFDLPSYDIELTPFLGKVLDGKAHEIAFSVTNALNVWYIDANLHLWLDENSTKTEGGLVSSSSPPADISLKSGFVGLDGKFSTGAKRSITSVGWVKSSHGKINTKVTQKFSYTNSMVMGNDGNLQIVDQKIAFNDSVHLKIPFSSSNSIETYRSFPLYSYSDVMDLGNNSHSYIANLKFGFNEKKVKAYGSRESVSSLNNMQNGQGMMLIKNNTVAGGVGSTRQSYRYDDNKFGYFRNVSSFNYTIIDDESGQYLQNKSPPSSLL